MKRLLSYHLLGLFVVLNVFCVTQVFADDQPAAPAATTSTAPSTTTPSAPAAPAAPAAGYVAGPPWLNTGNNAWQLAAATFVGLQSVPGLMLLYSGIVKRKWAINSAFMAMYAFAATLIVWVLWAYNMGFGQQWFPFLGHPGSTLSPGFELGQATVPAAASGMPELTFPMATLVFFQFVFAAITVIILGGSLIGRMNFLAWAIFVPLWITFVYTVGAFCLCGGGGCLAGLGAVDFSGGYVILLAAGASGFVAASVVLARD